MYQILINYCEIHHFKERPTSFLLHQHLHHVHHSGHLASNIADVAIYAVHFAFYLVEVRHDVVLLLGHHLDSAFPLLAISGFIDGLVGVEGDVDERLLSHHPVHEKQSANFR